MSLVRTNVKKKIDKNPFFLKIFIGYYLYNKPFLLIITIFVHILSTVTEVLVKSGLFRFAVF
jgi:hypothetical protein